MNKTVNIADAKATLSELVDAAVAGDDIVIARKGKPMVKLIPVAEMQPRKPGAAKHWKIPDDLFLKKDPEERSWLEGEHTDAYGVSLPAKRKRKKA